MYNSILGRQKLSFLLALPSSFSPSFNCSAWYCMWFILISWGQLSHLSPPKSATSLSPVHYRVRKRRQKHILSGFCWRGGGTVRSKTSLDAVQLLSSSRSTVVLATCGQDSNHSAIRASMKNINSFLARFSIKVSFLHVFTGPDY